MRGTIAKKIRRTIRAVRPDIIDVAANVKEMRRKIKIGEPVMGQDAEGNPELQQVTVDKVTSVRTLNPDCLKAVAKQFKREYNKRSRNLRAASMFK